MSDSAEWLREFAKREVLLLYESMQLLAIADELDAAHKNEKSVNDAEWSTLVRVQDNLLKSQAAQIAEQKEQLEAAQRDARPPDRIPIGPDDI